MSTRVGLACLLWGAFAQHAVAAESPANPPTVTLEGMVVDADGTPLDIFKLTVYQWGSEPQAHSFKRAEGRLKVDLAARRFGITLDAPGYATWFDTVAFNSAGSHDVGTVYLHPERAISGRVTDARTGFPIMGAVVQYAPIELEELRIDVREEYPLGWWATTDENGTFALSRLPERRVHLEVASVGHITRAVRLPAGRDRLDIELGGGATLEGSLSLAGGTPVEGTVTLRLESNRWRSLKRALERQVDRDGQFRFEGLAAGSYYLYARSAAGIVEGRRLTLAEDELASVGLLAEPLGRLTGSVSGLAESESVSIFVRRDDEWQSQVRQGQARFGNGGFVVHGIPDGDYVVQATATAHRDSRSITRKIRMVGGEATVDFNFAGRSRITGRVLAGPRPVSAIFIRAVPKDPSLPSAVGMSDVHGRYEILGLDDAEYELRAQLGLRGTERSFDVTVVPDTTFDIRLGPFALSGTVTSEADLPSRSANEANWVVQARLISARDEPVIFRGFTDSRGVYRFDGLEKGAYRVSLASPYLGGTRDVAIEGSSVEHVDIRPTRSDTREVRVVDADTKEALKDVSCEVQDGVWADSPVYDLEYGLPTTLIDANLTCSSRGYEPVHIRWDGDPLEINLVPRHP